MIDIGIYRPLYKKQSSLNVIMISSIGIMTVLINVIVLIFGNDTKVVDNSIRQIYLFGDIIITYPQMLQTTVGILIIGFLMFFKIYQVWSENESLK